MNRLVPIAAALTCALTLPRPASAEKVKAIEVSGNTKTTDATVILISGVEVGARFDFDMPTRIQERLVDSGLFRDVLVTYVAVEGGKKLEIVAKDKHSWAVAPTVYNQPTNKGGGVGFGENNLFGKNKKLLLYGQIATGDSFFIGAYVDPAIAGSRFRWQYDVYLKQERTIEYAAPTAFQDDPQPVRNSKMRYLNTGIKGGVNLPGGVSIDLRLRGAKVSFKEVEFAEGADEMDIEGAVDADGNPPPPGIEGTDVSGELIVESDQLANWYGIASGDRYRLSIERALPDLGSDFEYWYATLGVVRARRYYKRHNLIMKGSVGYGHDLPFQQEYSAGGTALRGYKNDHFRGDFKIAGSLEYSVPLFTIKGFSLRGLGFIDTSYITFLDKEDTDTFRNYLPNQSRLDVAPFKNSIGIGTRVYTRQIVLPLLGIDVGYGIENGAVELYLAIGLTDF